MTIREFLGVDSYDKRPDGSELGHEEKYVMVVNKLGLEECIKHIPATKAEVAKALAKGDRYLNTIPIRKWDAAAGFRQDGGHVSRTGGGLYEVMWDNGLRSVSLAECNCTLKAAARIWAEER